MYLVPDEIGEPALSGDWKLLDQTSLSFIGPIPISAVIFDSTKRKSLDPACFESVLG